MRGVLFIATGLVAFVAVAEKQPFERYQSIIDRQMFGQPPKGFDPTKLPSEVSKSSMSEKELTAEQEVIQKAIHFSVINITPSGEVAVGFSDNSDPKLPIHYYLKVGETENGWTVKEADAEKATMTIANEEGVEVALSLGDNSAAANGGGGSGGKGKESRANGRGLIGASRAGGLLGGSQTLRSRRRLREEADAAARAKEQAAADEKAAAEKAEREEREAAEKAEREAERAEQRKELLAIQEQLRRVREEKAQQNQNADDLGNEEN